MPEPESFESVLWILPKFLPLPRPEEGLIPPFSKLAGRGGGGEVEEEARPSPSPEEEEERAGGEREEVEEGKGGEVLVL